MLISVVHVVDLMQADVPGQRAPVKVIQGAGRDHGSLQT